ncbi:MAG: hypothetical protein JWN71_4168 [Xanthobacteraceae bacterium]|jgi:uncharacterized protein (DUF1499 family)|nr:hypothetical protein [Xanthobacteraceae bacterium]
MARRRIADQPTSRLALWARRLALFSLTATVLAVIIVRADMLEIRPALATVAGAMSFAMLAMVLALGSFVPIWREGTEGFGRALTAMGIGIALLAYPGYLGFKAYKLPAISDISTDPIEPPAFVEVVRLRERDANPTLYAGLYAAEQQRAAYPDVQPLLVQATPQAAFDAAIALANKRKWRVINARAPIAGRREGYAEAIARTPIMGFRDDVVIRVRTDPDGARIDLRSSSRYGRYDFGANAARIKSFLEDLEEQISDAAPEKVTPAPKKAQPARPAPAKR